jgi:hypothetical protein
MNEGDKRVMNAEEYPEAQGESYFLKNNKLYKDDELDPF